MVAAATPLEFVRIPCSDCRGSGQTTELYPGCRQCRAYWRPSSFDKWIEAHDRGIVYHLLHGHWTPPRWLGWLSWVMPRGRDRYEWNVALPCGHRFERLDFRPVNCRTCRGVGTIGHWELSAHYRERITPPAPRTSYRPSRYPPVAPMHTPLLAETTRTRLSLFDWQRGRNWTR